MCDHLMKFAPEHCGRLGVWRAALLYDLAANYLDAVLGPCTRARERESLDALEARLTQNARMLQVVRPATRVQATRLHNRNPTQKVSDTKAACPTPPPSKNIDRGRADVEVFDLLGRHGTDPSEMQSRLLELQSLILEAQRSLREAEDENRQLKRRIETLQTQDAVQNSPVFAENVYLKRNPEGDLDGPFCSCCWNIDRKLVRLIRRGERHWNERDEGMIRFDCLIHTTRVFLRPEVFNSKTIS